MPLLRTRRTLRLHSLSANASEAANHVLLPPAQSASTFAPTQTDEQMSSHARFISSNTPSRTLDLVPLACAAASSSPAPGSSRHLLELSRAKYHALYWRRTSSKNADPRLRPNQLRLRLSSLRVRRCFFNGQRCRFLVLSFCTCRPPRRQAVSLPPPLPQWQQRRIPPSHASRALASPVQKTQVSPLCPLQSKRLRAA